RGTAMPLHNARARLDLWLAFTERDGALHGELEYASALFDAATAQRIAAQYLRLVDALLSDADVPLSRVELMSEAERQQVRQQSAATSAGWPLDRCLPELFDRQVQRDAQALAL